MSIFAVDVQLLSSSSIYQVECKVEFIVEVILLMLFSSNLCPQSTDWFSLLTGQHSDGLGLRLAGLLP